MTRVTAQFFGPAADVAGCTERSYDLGDEATLGELIARLHSDYPQIESAAKSIRFAVNCEFAEPATRLRAGDEVAVIPPVSGG